MLFASSRQTRGHIHQKKKKKNRKQFLYASAVRKSTVTSIVMLDILCVSESQWQTALATERLRHFGLRYMCAPTSSALCVSCLVVMSREALLDTAAVRGSAVSHCRAPHDGRRGEESVASRATDARAAIELPFSGVPRGRGDAPNARPADEGGAPIRRGSLTCTRRQGCCRSETDGTHCADPGGALAALLFFLLLSFVSFDPFRSFANFLGACVWSLPCPGVLFLATALATAERSFRFSSPPSRPFVYLTRGRRVASGPF